MILLAALFATTSYAAPTVVVYSGSNLTIDKRNSYHVALLDLVLSKSGVRYELRPNQQKMVTARAWLELEINRSVNVLWGITTPTLEQRLLPIRTPIDKGILGWRLLMIKTRDRELFANIHTLDELKPLLAGLQNDWGDTAIMRANGMNVLGVSDESNLYPMMLADRFQYFPRSVGEIWGELDAHAAQGIEIEQHLALHYPVASYFFVSKKNPELARIIEKGLRVAISDGSLSKLFDQRNGDAMKKANLEGRLVFELDNPMQARESQ